MHAYSATPRGRGPYPQLERAAGLEWNTSLILRHGVLVGGTPHALNGSPFKEGRPAIRVALTKESS